MLTKLKSIVERAMTNKVESDNGRIKLMQMMANLEDLMMNRARTLAKVLLRQ
jgi:hypothetical protein